jgi:hypothetical protein
MSGTDKDRPRWVRENEPDNRLGEYHTCKYPWAIANGRKCDIDVASTPTGRKFCRYNLVDEHVRSKKWYDQVPKNIRREYYWKPERAGRRDDLGQVLKAARRGDEPDTGSELHGQHRHSPLHGGYWH